MYMCIYIYIYIEREREREIYRFTPNTSISTHICYLTKLLRGPVGRGRPGAEGYIISGL